MKTLTMEDARKNPNRKFSRRQAAEILEVKEHRIDDYARKGYLKHGVSARTGRRYFLGRHISEFYVRWQ